MSGTRKPCPAVTTSGAVARPAALERQDITRRQPAPNGAPIPVHAVLPAIAAARAEPTLGTLRPLPTVNPQDTHTPLAPARVAGPLLTENRGTGVAATEAVGVPWVATGPPPTNSPLVRKVGTPRPRPPGKSSKHPARVTLGTRQAAKPRRVGDRSCPGQTTPTARLEGTPGVTLLRAAATPAIAIRGVAMISLINSQAGAVLLACPSRHVPPREGTHRLLARTGQPRAVWSRASRQPLQKATTPPAPWPRIHAHLAATGKAR